MKKNIFKYILVVAVAILLLLPSTFFLGIKDKTGIIGFENPASLPSFQTESFKDKTFQNRFEEWWETRFGFRNFMLKCKNTLYDIANFRQIHSGYSGILIQTADGDLFSRNNINFLLNGILQHNTEELKYKLTVLNNNFKANGIVPLFVLASSKELLHQEKIPFRYRFFENRTVDIYEYWEKILSSLGILCFNTQKFIEEIDKNEYPPYSKTGFHWNQYGAVRVTQKVSEILGLNPITISEVNYKKKVWPSDRDYSSLLNTYFDYLPEEIYPQVKLAYTEPNNENITIIGDSFSEYVYNGLLLAEANNIEELFFASNRLISDDEAKKMLSQSKKFIFVNEYGGLFSPYNISLRNIDTLLNNMPHFVMRNWLKNDKNEYIGTEQSRIIIPNDYKNKLVTLELSSHQPYQILMNGKKVKTAAEGNKIKLLVKAEDFSGDSAVISFYSDGGINLIIHSLKVENIVFVKSDDVISLADDRFNAVISGFRDAESQGSWSVKDILKFKFFFAENKDYLLDFNIPYYYVSDRLPKFNVVCFVQNEQLDTWSFSTSGRSSSQIKIKKEMLNSLDNSVDLMCKIERSVDPTGTEGEYDSQNLGIFLHNILIK